jgi:hypothetical protein
MSRVIPPHTPHPPFIRLISEEGNAKVGRAYCSICRKQVGLRFTVHDGEEGEAWRSAIWSHVESRLPLPEQGLPPHSYLLDTDQPK